jgi:acetyl esterase/lipase
VRKFLPLILGLVAILAVGGYALYAITPWPRALMVRAAFDREAVGAMRLLERHAPSNVSSLLDVRYDVDDNDASLDVYYPASAQPAGAALPAIVWIHGGAWISGHKDYVGNYLKILAAQGYTAISVNYSLAPGATYPKPVRQVFEALAFLMRDPRRFHVDPARLVLAGDSAGAQIAAQVAAIATSPVYALQVGVAPTVLPAQIKGALLFCGAYDARSVNLDGAFGDFLRLVLWSYSGTRNFRDDPRFATFSVAHYVTPAFPPTFITAGNADPLEAQSKEMARTLKAKGVSVDELFFSAGEKPPLPHEYQFDLDGDAGRRARERALAFLARVAHPAENQGLGAPRSGSTSAAATVNTNTNNQ